MKHARVAVFLLVTLAVNSSAQGRGTANSCDRECLRGFITQYLDGMAKHSPALLTIGPNVRFTEDTKEIKLGEGLWKNFTKARAYRLDFLDVRSAWTKSLGSLYSGRISETRAVKVRATH